MILIRRIIKTFIHNPMPDEVQDNFVHWFLSKGECDLKNKALEEEWIEMCEDSREDTMSSVARWSRLREIHRKMDDHPLKKTGLYLSWGAVAAYVVFFFFLASWPLFLNVDPENEVHTCYVTSSLGKGEFTMPDGSHVWLNSDSRLEFIGDLSGKVRNVDLYGEAYFDVMPSDAFFVVNMGGIKVKVLGTEFNARNSESYGNYEVTLKSGKVQVESDSFDSVSLEPGQQFIASTDLRRASVRKVNADNYTSWTGEVLSFDNKRLETVIVNLEHWFNVDVEIDKTVDRNVRLSLTVRHESLSKTLDLIKILVGCNYSSTGEGKILITQ